MKIILEQSFEGGRWSARLESEDGPNYFGDTVAQALAEVITHKKKELGIELDVRPFKKN